MSIKVLFSSGMKEVKNLLDATGFPVPYHKDGNIAFNRSEENAKEIAKYADII